MDGRCLERTVSWMDNLYGKPAKSSQICVLNWMYVLTATFIFPLAKWERTRISSNMDGRMKLGSDEVSVTKVILSFDSLSTGLEQLDDKNEA